MTELQQLADALEERLDSSEPPEEEPEGTSQSLKTKILSWYSKSERLSEVLDSCKDEKAQRHAIWADLFKFATDKIKTTLKISFLTTMVVKVVEIIGAEGMNLLLNGILSILGIIT